MTSRRDQQDQDTSRRGDRIAKLLARAGVASRREVERMIDDGRVAHHGTVLTTPNTVLTSLAGVTVDGQPVAAPAPARLFLFHKPVGLLVTERDPRGRPTIYDRLPADLPRVVPVGRLDLNTEGLLLLTTDGGLKRQLELPATGVERTYRARAYGQISQAQLEDLIDGIEIEGVRYGQIDANLERRTGANVWIELTLAEGKNREVRRVLEHLGLQVGRLIRTRYGPFLLGELQPGEIGEVRQADLIAYRQSLSGKRARLTDPIAPAPLRPQRGETEAVEEPTTRPARQPRTSAGSGEQSGRPSTAAGRAPTGQAPRSGDRRRSGARARGIEDRSERVLQTPRSSRPDRTSPSDARGSRSPGRSHAPAGARDRSGDSPRRDNAPTKPFARRSDRRDEDARTPDARGSRSTGRSSGPVGTRDRAAGARRRDDTSEKPFPRRTDRRDDDARPATGERPSRAQSPHGADRPRRPSGPAGARPPRGGRPPRGNKPGGR